MLYPPGLVLDSFCLLLTFRRCRLVLRLQHYPLTQGLQSWIAAPLTCRHIAAGMLLRVMWYCQHTWVDTVSEEHLHIPHVAAYLEDACQDQSAPMLCTLMSHQQCLLWLSACTCKNTQILVQQYMLPVARAALSILALPVQQFDQICGAMLVHIC